MAATSCCRSMAPPSLVAAGSIACAWPLGWAGSGVSTLAALPSPFVFALLPPVRLADIVRTPRPNDLLPMPLLQHLPLLGRVFFECLLLGRLPGSDLVDGLTHRGLG